MTGDDRHVLEELLAAQARRQAVALAVIIRDQGSVPRHAGTKMLVYADGRTLGTVGGGTVLFALAIGPLVSYFLKRLTIATVPTTTGEAH